MRGPWRLALAAALYLTVGSGMAAAQTVIIRNAPEGSALELVLNEETIASAKADAKGDGTLAVNLPAHGGRAEADVNITLDVCEGVRRVILVERGLQAPALQGQNCTRHPVPELFALRPVTTLVVNMGTSTPTVWVRQGQPPPQWLREETEEERVAARQRRPSPTGFVLTGGFGWVKIDNIVQAACGTLEECKTNDFVSAFTGGVTLWVTRWLAFEGTYTRPLQVTASAAPSGTHFNFESTFDTHIVNLGAKVAVPIGPVRLYGQGGTTYHQANFITEQTNETYTVDTGDGELTLPGGSQTFTLRTDGWSYNFGGGLEAWFKPKWAIFGEVGRSLLRGKTMDEGEGEIDSPALSLLLGFRVKIGG